MLFRSQPGVASPPADGTHGAGQPTIRSPGGLPRPMVSVPSEDDSPEGPPILLVRRLRRSQVPAEELAVKVPPPPRSLADGRHEATSVQPVPTAPIPAASSAVTEASAEVDGADFEAPRSLPAEPNSLDGEMVTAAAASPPAPAEPPADVLCTSAREVVEGHPPPSPLEYVADADSPKELTERVLAALEPWCRVAMVFRVRARDYQLMEARGCRVRELSISAELPSVIATAVKVGGYSGGLPGGPAHVSLASLLDMHSDREELVVGVVRVAGRPTLALLAVGAAGTDSARHVETIASIAGDTLTALLRKRKHDG